jgi:hypothetical protein
MQSNTEGFYGTAKRRLFGQSGNAFRTELSRGMFARQI